MEVPAFPWLEEEPEASRWVRLRSVFLHVTKACNLRCMYCYFSANRPLPDEMNMQEFEKLWLDLVIVRPRRVIFTGGEPLLRPDILDLLRGLRKADAHHHMLRCLNTNGHLLTKEVARQLVGLVDELRVSVDALPARNDALRGRGSFDAAMRALDLAYSVGFEPKALVTVTSDSFPDLEELLCLLVGRHITRINLNLFRPIGRGRRKPTWRVGLSQVDEVVRRAWERCRGTPQAVLLSGDTKSDDCVNCGIGQFANIMPNGDVFPCHVLVDRNFGCGNVRNQGFLAICRRSGFLGKLAALDFRELATRDSALAVLEDPSTCLGDIDLSGRLLTALSTARDHPRTRK